MKSLNEQLPLSLVAAIVAYPYQTPQFLPGSALFEEGAQPSFSLGLNLFDTLPFATPTIPEGGGNFVTASDEEVLDLQYLARTKLGSLGEERLSKFISYPDKWDGKDAAAVSPRALDAMRKFLANAHFESSPSVFLTEEGHLALMWRDPEGLATNLEFGSNSIECYSEAADEEEVFPISSAAGLMNQLQIAHG